MSNNRKYKSSGFHLSLWFTKTSNSDVETSFCLVLELSIRNMKMSDNHKCEECVSALIDLKQGAKSRHLNLQIDLFRMQRTSNDTPAPISVQTKSISVSSSVHCIFCIVMWGKNSFNQLAPTEHYRAIRRARAFKLKSTFTD